MKEQARGKKVAMGRLLAAFLIAAAAQGAAQAQTDSTPPSHAQSLSCLKQPDAAISYPSRHRFDRGGGFMRLRLHFEKPDAAPRVEVLANTAREDMQDLVYRHVGDYRLPCLKPGDGTVSAVQEFDFNHSAMEALPVPEAPRRRLPFCIVMPRKDVEPLRSHSRDLDHVVVSALFSGDGEQPPEVKVLHSSGNKRLEETAIERALSYRMPCRTGREEPQVMRQQFSYVPPGHRRTVLTREAFGLAEFLGLTQGAEALKAHFDFRTMSCPFKVSYTIYGPALPNEVHVVGDSDPNRLPFLAWLRERQLAFSSDRQANELFGTPLQIHVPCGQLNLQPETPEAAGS